jgi:hypothetical protein
LRDAPVTEVGYVVWLHIAPSIGGAMVDGGISLAGVPQGEGLNFQPPNSRFYHSMAGVAPGEVVFISASVEGMPLHTGVRVIYADDESFTVMTPEGHPESGRNTSPRIGTRTVSRSPRSSLWRGPTARSTR